VSRLTATHLTGRRPKAPVGSDSEQPLGNQKADPTQWCNRCAAKGVRKAFGQCTVEDALAEVGGDLVRPQCRLRSCALGNRRSGIRRREIKANTDGAFLSAPL